MLIRYLVHLSIMVLVAFVGVILVVFPEIFYAETFIVWIGCLVGVWFFLGSLVGVPLLGLSCCFVVWPVFLAWLSLRSQKTARAAIVLNVLVAASSSMLVRFHLINGMFM